MSPEAKPAASDSLIALIQPFVDDELAPADRARVEAVLAEDPVLRDMVEEQRTVRQVLRDMSRETAPQALQARVLLELDAVDRERAAEAELNPAASPARIGARVGARVGLAARLRSFLRGAAVMVPAGATALALFLVTRTGTERHVLEASPAVATAAATAPLIVGAGPAAPAPAGVRLVGAALPGDPRDGELGKARSIIVERRVGDRLVLDHHEPADGRQPAATGHLRGPTHEYRGRSYWLGQVQGRPAVAFESDGVRHTLSRGDERGLRDAREYMLLLSLGHALRDAERPR
jgi:negative regulator of sigma E activity